MEKGGVSKRGIKILKKLRGIFHVEDDVDSARKTFMTRMESRGIENCSFRERSRREEKFLLLTRKEYRIFFRTVL